MALIYAFCDETGQWHGDDPQGDVGWSPPSTGWLTFRPASGQPGQTSPFVGQRLEVLYASTGDDGYPGPVAYQLDDGKRYYPTMRVHELLAGHRAPTGGDDDPPLRDGYPAESDGPGAIGSPPEDDAEYENVAGQLAPAVPGPVYLDVNNAEHHYDISAEPTDDGRVRVEVLGAGPDGERVAQLHGELPAGDLLLLGRLFFGAAAQISSRHGPRMGTGLSRQRGAWTDEEKQLLAARHLAGTDIAGLAAELGRTQRAVRFKLHDLRLGPWPSDDMAERRQAPPKPLPAYTMEDLRRTYPNSHKPWTAEDDAHLAARFAEGATVEDLMAEFGRNYNAITARLGRFGALPPWSGSGQDQARSGSGGSVAS